MATEAASRRKSRVGRVVSDKMQRTVVVVVERFTAHPLYKKRMRRSVRYKAHNADDRARTGDWVRIEETRPLSKEKRWTVVEILGPGGVSRSEGEPT
jgi:small subunit ribosomal protein S17